MSTSEGLKSKARKRKLDSAQRGETRQGKTIRGYAQKSLMTVGTNLEKLSEEKDRKKG